VLSASRPTCRPVLYIDVMPVCAAVTAISLALAVMPVPPMTFTVDEAPSDVEPPPVSPVPAVIVTALLARWALSTEPLT